MAALHCKEPVIDNVVPNCHIAIGETFQISKFIEHKFRIHAISITPIHCEVQYYFSHIFKVVKKTKLIHTSIMHI